MSITSPARRAVREERRARNAEDGEPAAARLVCECTRGDCDLTVPALAASHRQPGEFVVAPLHLDGDSLVLLDDRFLVVRTWSPGRGEGNS